MVRGDAEAGLHLRTDSVGWRRVCALTHSHFSRTEDELRRVAEAEAIVECMLQSYLSHYQPFYHTCNPSLCFNNSPTLLSFT